MSTFAMFVMFAVAAFLVAWVTNGVVGLLSGERPRDTGRLWLDTFCRIFAVLELGWVGRLLNRAGVHGLSQKFVLFVGLVCVLLFFLRDCRHEKPGLNRSYPVQSR